MRNRLADLVRSDEILVNLLSRILSNFSEVTGNG